MGYLVSIIIPVYNVEKYLDKCMESVVKQTYSELEIILVDDGSTDDSGIICEQWKNKDNRIKVIHQGNGGLAHARNEGMKLATGQYVLFVDSDDWIDLDMVEILVQGCVKNDTEIAVCRYRKIYKDHIEDNGTSESFVCSGKEALNYHIFEREKQYCFCYAVWNKLYKKELIEGIEFPKGMHFEDVGYTSRVLYSAKKVYYTDAAKYNYLIERDGSIMNRGFTERKITDELVLLDREIDFFQKENLEECVDFCVERLLTSVYLYYWQVIRNKNVKKKNQCIEILRNLHFKYKYFYKGKRGKTIKRMKIAIFEKIPLLVPFGYACLLKIRLILKK